MPARISPCRLRLPLAATSLDGVVRRVGPLWKTLQRAVYAAGALAQFAPLAGPTLYRLWWLFLRSRPLVIA